MKKKILLLFFCLSVFASFPALSQVNWLTIEEAEEKNKTEKRKFFIDVYANWCGWCKVMDRETFTNPVVAKVLNDKYYPVKFNAESREDVSFFGKEFKNTGKTHDFAIYLTSGALSYPTTVYLDENGNILTPVPGYLTPKKIDPILHYFSLDVYKESPFGAFQKNYKSKIN